MKILILEDEPQIAEVLIDILRKIKSETEFVATLDSIDATVQFLSGRQNIPDLIFMDIQLADGLSFEIFSRIEVTCPVIFCTAYDQYTLQAFKSNGVEYILKPIREEDIRAAFDKLEILKQSFNSDRNILEIIRNTFPEQKNFRTSLLVQYKGSYIPLAVDNIAFFFVSNEMVYAHCFDNKKYSVFKAMEEIESTLNPKQFYRISRQHLINRASIKEIQSYVNRKVVIKTALQSSEQLIVSRLKVSTFLKWVEQP